MKKLIVILFVLPLLFSCNRHDKFGRDIKELKNEKQGLITEKRTLKNDVGTLKHEVHYLLTQKTDLIKEIEILDDSIMPVYLLSLELKQSHVSLDLGKHVKDEMNKITFTLPVDRDYYNSVNVGDNIVDKFRQGSMWTEGSFGNWKVKVTGKEIKRRE